METIEKNYKIKYVPTGNIFELPKSECDRLIIEDSHNFVVIDEDYKLPITEESASSIETSILGEDNSHDEQDINNPYKDTSIWKNKASLEDELKIRNIDFSSAKNRADLEKLLVDNDKEQLSGNND
ncbi:MAG: hypothetical protein WCK67_07920 [bacterium]